MQLRLAVAGIGNNISALLQGIHYYRGLLKNGPEPVILPGIREFRIGEYAVVDIDIVAGFDVHTAKIGIPIEKAIFCPPNNYPDLSLDIPDSNCTVGLGLRMSEGAVVGRQAVVEALRNASAEVLLYSLPTGLQDLADAYAQCALDAGACFVNCTPEVVARNPDLMKKFEQRTLSLIGDDLASQMGASVLHRKIIDLLLDRGLNLESTYQVNLGGNEDFRNLRIRGQTKEASKKNALARDGLDLDRVHVIPSGGVVASLRDRKVAYLSVVGRGWANTPVYIDVKLDVQDSSNAAGVIIDLVRLAAAAKRAGMGGFCDAAAGLLKSPPGTASAALGR
jgi:myo-inositol-1-phosphate synthase